MKPHRSAYDSIPKGLAYLLPGLAVYALFVLVPVARTLAFSFFEWDGLSPRTFVGAANYAELLRDGRFYGSLSHNLALVLYLLALPGAIGLFLAAIVSMKDLRGGKFFEILFFEIFTHVAPFLPLRIFHAREAFL